MYYLVLLFGLFFITGAEYVDMKAYVLAYGLISATSVIVITIIVMMATNGVRVTVWSVTATTGLFFIFFAPSIIGLHAISWLNSGMNARVKPRFDGFGSEPSTGMAHDTMVTTVSCLLSLGFLFYAVAVLAGNMYKINWRNGLAVAAALVWIMVLLDITWQAEVFEHNKHVALLTIALVGSLSLAFIKPTVVLKPNASGETEPLVAKSTV